VPELPEVEVTRRAVAARFVGRRLSAVVVRNARLRYPVPRAVRALAGERLLAVRRRGKYLLLGFARAHLIVHLGMSGSLRLVASRDPPGAHDHVDLVFGSRALRLRDPRRFGALLCTSGPPEAHPLLRGLGAEPLAASFDGRTLYRLTRGRRATIKSLLMDARTIAGLGNIYAAEALFRAGVRPTTRAARLSLARCERLARAIRATLREAIRAGGSSLRDYAQPGGAPGEFQLRALVYRRAGEPCRRCGATIRRSRHGARTTYWCARCQR